MKFLQMIKPMRSGSIALLSAALLLAGCSAPSSTSRREKNDADFQHTAALIERGNYLFTVRSASPSGGRTIQLTSRYTLKAADGTYAAVLPYYGRAYAGGYGYEGGISFRGEPEDLEITRDDSKNSISVEFTIQMEKDRFTVILKLGAAGYGNLTISSQNRQPISYYGLAGELTD